MKYRFFLMIGTLVGSLFITCGTALALKSVVPETGQITSYATGDDGSLAPGVPWPSPRFTDNGNGTVTDNLTGLIWLKNANCTETVAGIPKASGYLNWANALTWSNGLASGRCSLSDGSSAADWRLPDKLELESLTDVAKINPALPTGHPFTGVQSDYYWSSTTYADDTVSAWLLYLYDGSVGNNFMINNGRVWPVRGGQFGNSLISISPSSKAFGNVIVGETRSQTVTISNTAASGSSRLQLNAITLREAHPSVQFSINPGDGSGGTCGSTTPIIAAGASCTVNVSFSPTSLGAKSATMRISGSDVTAPNSDIPLTGRGSGYIVAGSVIGGNGSISSANSLEILSGATGSFTLAPDSTYKHSDTVSGSCPSGTFNGNTYTTGAITSDCTVNFSFTKITYPLTITFAGAGGGTVAILHSPSAIDCTGTCSQSLEINTSVLLTPTANTGSSFTGWSGCDSLVNETCIVSMTGVKNVTAIFTPHAAVNGVCGSSDGKIFGSVPTDFLCTIGAPSVVTGSGPWSWSCVGANSGTTASCSAITSGVWTLGTAMQTGRSEPGVIALDANRTLVCGGSDIQSCEIYNLTTGQWSSVASMNAVGSGLKLFKLSTGKILGVGGNTPGTDAGINETELYDPVANTWQYTGSLQSGTNFHGASHSAAIQLADGKVLVAGSRYYPMCDSSPVSQTYDPTTGQWTLAGDMNTPRQFFGADNSFMLLNNGKVLVVGGLVVSGCGPNGYTEKTELFDPTTRQWTYTGDMSTPRYAPTLTKLVDGRVLTCGGKSSDAVHLNSCEIYNPATGLWTATGSMNTAANFRSSILMPDGKVLVAGGRVDPSTDLAATEIYNPVTGQWMATGLLNVARAQHRAIWIGNKIMVLGGYDANANQQLASIESYSPADLSTGLVAWYPFNGNANDASGNGNNGTVNGATLTMDRFGNANSAYSFNGSSSYIDILNLNSQDVLSLSLWVYNAGNSDGVLIAGDNSGFDRSIRLFNPDNNVTIHTGNGASFANINVPLSTWTHVVLEYTSSDIKLFINGLNMWNLGAPATGWNEGNWRIGADHDSPADISKFFNGKIDDVRIYNRALSSAEVLALYQQQDPSINIPIDAEHWNVIHRGPSSFTSSGLQVNGSGFRVDNELRSSQGFDYSGSEVYVMWQANGAGTYMGAGPSVQLYPHGQNPHAYYNSTTTDHSFGGSTTIQDNTWLYTRFAFPGDTSGTVSVIVASGNYDNAGGTVLRTDTFPASYGLQGLIAAGLGDNYGSTSAYLVLGEVKTTARAIPIATLTTYDFNGGTPPSGITVPIASTVSNNTLLVNPDSSSQTVTLDVTGYNWISFRAATDDNTNSNWNGGFDRPQLNFDGTYGATFDSSGSGNWVQISMPIPAGTQTVTIVSSAGYRLWLDDIKLSTVTATTTYPLSLNISGQGTGAVHSSPLPDISCLSVACSQSYTPGTSVTLTATAAPGSTFSGWSGACVGSGTCSVTMNSAKDVTATFVRSGDIAAPSITEFTIPSTATSLTVDVSRFIATDDTAVTGYLITQSATPPAASDPGWSGSAPSSFTFVSPGNCYAYAWAKDAAGNVSSAAVAVVNITIAAATDTLAPLITAFTVPPASSLTPAITAFAVLDNVGVTGYFVSESGTTPTVVDPGWSGSAPTSFTFATYGTKTLYAWAKDAAGNISVRVTAYTTLLDPAQAIDTLLTGWPGNPDRNTPSTFSFVANQAGATFECSMDGQSWFACTSPISFGTLAKGGHMFSVRAKSSLGVYDSTPVDYIWTVAVPLVKIDLNTYTGLIEAYTISSNDSILKIKGVEFGSIPAFNRPVAITLKGGHNASFSSTSGSSILHGTVVISAGTVTFDGITIQ